MHSKKYTRKKMHRKKKHRKNRRSRKKRLEGGEPSEEVDLTENLKQLKIINKSDINKKKDIEYAKKNLIKENYLKNVIVKDENGVDIKLEDKNMPTFLSDGTIDQLDIYLKDLKEQINKDDEIIKKCDKKDNSCNDNNICNKNEIKQQIIEENKKIKDREAKESTKVGGSKWTNCIGECFTSLKDLVKQEIESTAYMLRILSSSVIGGDKNNKVTFTINNSNIAQLTGLWKKDYQHFRIEINSENQNKTGRLIMGFGPSASGKTFLAKKVIEMMKKIDKEFPTFFITIDGGEFRDKSFVYQRILIAIKELDKYDGLVNLVSTSKLYRSIFKNDIKDNIKYYLKHEKKQNPDLVVNLYIPDTLGFCPPFIGCKSKYQPYIDITGDKNWIGLMIYQHKACIECPYKDEYKCRGTTESGTSRQITEGKEYSSSAWNNSYKNGNASIQEAPNYRFRIHNSGRLDGTSIFEDLSVKKIVTVKEYCNDPENKLKYIEGELINSTECNKISTECNKK